jgi:nicotinamidase-related amidase
MAEMTFDKQLTALLVIDPYNDFISEGGKVWNRLKEVAEANNYIPHMLQVLNVTRMVGLRVFYALHHRYRPGDFETWKYIAPIQKAAWKSKVFEYGSWGGENRSEFAPQSARSSPWSISVPAVSPTPIWTCSSRSTASFSSSSSVS